MARNEVFISAPPRQVWDILADARSYAHWVFGSREIKAADRHWPEPGSAFDNAIGPDGFGLRGTTSVEASTPPVLLRLRIRTPPLPDTAVRLELVPEGDGTRVILHEGPAHRLISLLAGPLGHAVIRLRNVESLTRLKELAEGTTARPGGRLARRGEQPGVAPVRARRQRLAAPRQRPAGGGR